LVGRLASGLTALSLLFSLFQASSAHAADDLLCALMPISVSGAVVSPLAPGEVVTQLAIKQSHGNFSGLTWTGNNSSVYLAQSLLLPGNADQYTNPDDPSDSRLEVGDWVQGLPGVNNSSAVRAALNELLGVEITIPAWDQSRGTGSGLDYHVTGFEMIALNAYKLGGNGWISFTYLGPGRCYNEPPTAEDQSYTVDEDTSIGLTLAATDEDGDPLTYEVVQTPAHGQLSGSAPDLGLWSPVKTRSYWCSSYWPSRFCPDC